MPELEFKGKEFVRNHHLTVPFRPLVPDAGKSVGAVNTDGNLIIQGDNLEALKALLPLYAGKVDCIFIDPPYNTGNEGWCYNDNVNSPQLKAWFSENPVGIEDGLRHDKWCCMMWPRLKLLWELLSETGVICITIDSNEVSHALCLCDAIFGAGNRIAELIWRKVDSPNDNKVPLTPDHDYVLLYAKDKARVRLSKKHDDSILLGYRGLTEDGLRYRDRLLKKNGKNSLRKDRPTMFYPLTAPDGVQVFPMHDNGEEACWAMGKESVMSHEAAGTLIWKERVRSTGTIWEPYTREFAPEEGSRPFPTIWSSIDTMRQAQAMLTSIFGMTAVFSTPKPVALLSELFTLLTLDEESIILDSFAGSGTTAHAVLNLNAKDGGNRKFILVELEDYADTLTAERVRRVIRGYPFQGTQRETLYEKKLNWTELKKGDQLRSEAENTKTLYESQYDSVKITVDEGVLKVIGERKVSETAPGLGGEFTYCTLGEPLDLLKMLSGESLPARDAIGDWLLYCASGKRESDSLPTVPAELKEHLLGKQGAVYYWLLYRPDLDWLQSPAAALTLSLAEAIHAVDPSATHRVFSPVKYVPNKMLRELGQIEHATIPFAFFRRGGA